MSAGKSFPRVPAAQERDLVAAEGTPAERAWAGRVLQRSPCRTVAQNFPRPRPRATEWVQDRASSRSCGAGDRNRIGSIRRMKTEIIAAEMMCISDTAMKTGS